MWAQTQNEQTPQPTQAGGQIQLLVSACVMCRGGDSAWNLQEIARERNCFKKIADSPYF